MLPRLIPSWSALVAQQAEHPTLMTEATERTLLLLPTPLLVAVAEAATLLVHWVRVATEALAVEVLTQALGALEFLAKETQEEHKSHGLIRFLLLAAEALRNPAPARQGRLPGRAETVLRQHLQERL